MAAYGIKSTYGYTPQCPQTECGKVLLVGSEYVLQDRLTRQLFFGDYRARIAGRSATLNEALPRLKSAAIDLVLLGHEFSPEELVHFAVDARNVGYRGVMVQIGPSLRSSSRSVLAKRTARIQAGDFIVDVDSHRAWVRRTEIRLTPQEFELLAYFSKHPKQLLSHDNLREILWGSATAPIEPLRVLIKTLRAKVEDGRIPRYILTQHRLGYRFNPSPRNGSD
jgi:DNA-binding response OmpR family regulator